MTSYSFLLCLLLGAILCCGNPVKRSSCDDAYTDRKCGEDPTKLWLEIVIVVDNSKGMTNTGLQAAAAQIASIVDDNQQLGIQSRNPMTTRIGIVTYNQAATVVADLNHFTSVEQYQNEVGILLGKVSTIQDSYLHEGLQAASTLFEQQSENTDRGHYQRLVIVYSSEYRGIGQQDPLPLAIRMQQRATIATVAFSQDNSIGFLQELSKIATPGYNFTNENGENTITELQQTMLQVNCYCPNEWYQMRRDFSNENSFKYGVCLRPITIQAKYTPAKLACRNTWNRAYLVNEYNKAKHDYVLQIVANNSAFEQPYQYYIGLYYSNGKWLWERPVGEDPVQLQNWNDWNPGYPTASSTATVAINVQSSSSSISTGWQNTKKELGFMYVCEVASCDSTNYCAAEDL